MINFEFKSTAHAVAYYFHKVVAKIPAIIAGAQKVKNTETVVEGVSALAAPQLVPVESAAYACLGGIIALLTAGDAAIEGKLLDLGLDKGAIDAAKAVAPQASQVIALAKAL